jgi:AraC family transcriptional regulator, ethanolamine operon transcriptional activator
MDARGDPFSSLRPAPPRAHLDRDTCPLHGIFPAGLVGSYKSNDFDELAAIPPLWKQEYAQLGHGSFRGELFMAHTAQMALGRTLWAPGVMIRGSIPPNTVMFALPTRLNGPAWHRGEEVSSDFAALLFDDEEIDLRAISPFGVIVLAVERYLLEQQAQAITGHPLDSLRDGAHVILRNAPALRQNLSQLVMAIESRVMQDPAPLSNPFHAAAIERTFAEQILRAIRAPEVQADAPERQRIARKAEAILRQSLNCPISIGRLCIAVGTSERTLHAAFREHLGVTPKAYLKMLRLNAARRDLRLARPGTTVTDVAIRWDFLHFGWFAHDYLTMFGESPSQTLQRAQ